MNIPALLSLLSSMASDLPAAIASTRDLPGAESTGHRFPAKLARAGDRYRLWCRQWKDRYCLDSFNDHLLTDIGLDRGGSSPGCDKPTDRRKQRAAPNRLKINVIPP